MKFLHFIPHVNRADLTLKAIKSVSDFWDKTILIDNSDKSDLNEQLESLGFNNEDIQTIVPSVPLTTAQTYNFMHKIAKQDHCDYMTFMHNDCQVLSSNGCNILSRLAESYFKTHDVGMIRYGSTDKETSDLFCAYKIEMLDDIGGWDWLFFPFYVLDIDFERRLLSKGWKIIPNNQLVCVHHNDSSTTIKNDHKRQIANAVFFNSYQQLWQLKWHPEVMNNLSKVIVENIDTGFALKIKNSQYTED